MIRSGRNKRSLEDKIITCHCGASFTKWTTLKDYADFSVYHICFRCLCELQKLTHDQQDNPIWVNLPENPRSCPKIGKMRKCYLLITERFTKIRETFKRFVNSKEITPKELDRLLEQGWRLRRKKIKGRLYAYLQLGKKYKYIGPWKQEYEDK